MNQRSAQPPQIPHIYPRVNSTTRNGSGQIQRQRQCHQNRQREVKDERNEETSQMSNLPTVAVFAHRVYSLSIDKFAAGDYYITTPSRHFLVTETDASFHKKRAFDRWNRFPGSARAFIFSPICRLPPQYPYSGRFFGKPLSAISRFSYQDAQTPPSPTRGEGGWGDEGQKRTGMQKTAHLSQELYL